MVSRARRSTPVVKDVRLISPAAPYHLVCWYVNVGLRTRFRRFVLAPLNGLILEHVATFNKTLAAKYLNLQAASTVDVKIGSAEMNRIVAGEYAFVCTTPEVVCDQKHPLREQLLASNRNVIFMAVDEAHLSKEWGEMDCKVDDEAFRKAFAEVGEARASMPNPVIAITLYDYITGMT